jgi:hypothetical protein
MKKKLLLPFLFVVGLGAAVGASTINKSTASSEEVTVLICDSKTAYAYHKYSVT